VMKRTDCAGCANNSPAQISIMIPTVSGRREKRRMARTVVRTPTNIRGARLEALILLTGPGRRDRTVVLLLRERREALRGATCRQRVQALTGEGEVVAPTAAKTPATISVADRLTDAQMAMTGAHDDLDNSTLHGGPAHASS